MTSPHFHQEIARQRHSELVRRAEQERLARQIPDRDGVALSVLQRLRKAAGGRTATQLEPRHT